MYAIRSELSGESELRLQETRRAANLKLRLTFQHIGHEGLDQLIAESYRLTAEIRGRVAEHDALELASEPKMNLVCFRAAPDWCPPEELDVLNRQLQRWLLSERNVFVSLPTYRNDRWLRVVLLNPFTDEPELDRLVDGIDVFLDAERP